MLRKRFITVLTFNDGVLFRTKLFKPDYRYTLNFVDAWSVDEIVVLDVTRPGQGDRENFRSVVKEFSQRCFVPLSAGGAIRTMDDVDDMMRIGADKVVINTAALERPEFITEIAKRYGSQSIVLSIDAKPVHAQSGDSGEYQVFSNFASKAEGRSVEDWAREGQERGAGEILVTAIEKDGWLQGYDLELCERVSNAVSIPVLVLGGAGNWLHMVDAFKKGGASGACTQNIYHFTESAIHSAKRFLKDAGILVRT